MKKYTMSHLIKSEDLNHHGTLFAGKGAAWLVEAAFVAAAAEHGRPQDVLCVNIHGFVFKKSAYLGDVVTLTAQVVKLGTTSITVHVKLVSEILGTDFVGGFLTFVCVEPDSLAGRPHGLVLDEPADEEEKQLREAAQKLGK